MSWTPPFVRWFEGGLLRDVASGHPLGDVTTLANAEVVDQIHGMVKAGASQE